MIVKMNTSAMGPTFCAHRGDTADIPDALATLFISMGYAEMVAESGPQDIPAAEKEIETAVPVDETEKAVIPRRGRKRRT